MRIQVYIILLTMIIILFCYSIVTLIKTRDRSKLVGNIIAVVFSGAIVVFLLQLIL